MSSSNGYDYNLTSGYSMMRPDQYRYNDYAHNSYSHENHEKYYKKLQEDSQTWARHSQYCQNSLYTAPPPYQTIHPPLPPTAPPDLLPPPPRAHIQSQAWQYTQPPPLPQQRHNYSNEMNNSNSHNNGFTQNNYPQNNHLQNNYTHNTWQQRNGGCGNKRPRHEEQEDVPGSPTRRSSKKKRKPLSQNIPNKRNWDLRDAERALNIEKELNKPFKNRSLIIKFPDLEVNKDIVAAFNSGIDNVHFQQPSTPRYCFVTLKDDANAEEVISSLNKTSFGTGNLTAEFKKDRESDLNIGPNDIDPLTLYIGNLANEVTKSKVERLYPNHKRIDIGYAKKMKNTRYAFVTFKNVQDAVESFERTHKTELYGKSIIVRFNRLHGTIGKPGESKPQNPPKENLGATTTQEQQQQIEDEVELVPGEEQEDDVLITSFIKQEPVDEAEEEEVIEQKPVIDSNFKTPFLANGLTVDDVIRSHLPKIKTETEEESEEKKEEDEENDFKDSDVGDLNVNPDVKDEPHFSFFSDGDSDSDSDGSSRVFSLPSRGNDHKPVRFGNPITNVFHELLRQATGKDDGI